MGKKPQPDLIAELEEWNQHMYSPGYWVNRISLMDKSSWRWIRKHNRLMGVYGWLVSIPSLLVVFYITVQDARQLKQPLFKVLFNFANPFRVYVFGFLLLVGFMFVVHTILFFQQPVVDDEPDETPHPKQEKKKKLPKRRKDYH